MVTSLDPGLLRDLIEAKAAVARHGIVLIRSIEDDLAAAIVAAAKESVEASPKKLSQMDESELDRYMVRIRKRALKSSSQLAEIYRRLLTRLGTENIIDLQKDLEGIGELFTWGRIEQAAKEVDAVLEEGGFGQVDMGSANSISDDFCIELEERWPAAYKRFRALSEEAAEQLRKREEGSEPDESTLVRKRRTRR